jgi:hypothetical protein
VRNILQGVGVVTDTTQTKPINTDMKTTTPAERILALSTFLGYSLPSGTKVVGLPRHFVEFPNGDGYAVVTMDEACTTPYAFDDGRNATEEDCVTIGEETFVIFPYLGNA